MVKKSKTIFSADIHQAFRLQCIIAIFGVVVCLVLDNLESLKMTINNPMIYQEGSVMCVQYFYFNAVSFGGVFSSYLMPIMAALPFAASYSIEEQNRLVIYKIARSDKKQYFTSKILVAALTGGITIVAGSLLFTLILATYLPIVTPGKVFEMTGFPYHNALAMGNGLPYMTIVFYLAFLSGTLWSSAGMCISAFLPNPYLAICFPMIFQFLVVELGRLLHLPNGLRLDMLLCARGTFLSNGMTLIVVTIAVAALIALFGKLFANRCERRLDCVS